jgi:hypothetical protein
MTFFDNFKIADRFTEVVKRFPVVITFAVLTTLALIFLIDDTENDLLRWPIAGYIGFLLVLNWSVFAESFAITTKKYWIGLAILMIILAIYGYFIPSSLTAHTSCFWYFTLGLSLILHLLCSVVPFFKTYDTRQFVNYNINIFLAWIRAAFYALVVFIAMGLALVAMDQLFEISITPIYYFRLFIFLTGIFQVAFFLSDFPDDFYQSNREHSPVFKVFVNYVAIPVTIVYGTILYAYTLRLLLGYEMVEWVFVLCIWYFVVGILTWLFSLYFEDFEDNQWMTWFRKWYFMFSTPILILMFMSLYHNYQVDGLKEEGYMGTAIAIFAFIISIYGIIKRHIDLRAFPITLMGMCAIVFWSGKFSICKYPIISQQQKVKHDLTQAGMIENDVIDFDTTKVFNIKDQGFISRLYFLNDRGGLDFIKDMDVNKLLNHNDLVTSLSKYTNMSFSPKADNSFSFFDKKNAAFDVQGYQKMIEFTSYKPEMMATYALVQNDTLEVVMDKNEIFKGKITDIIYPLCSANPKHINFELSGQDYDFKVLVFSVSGTMVDKERQINDISGMVLVRDKTKE